MPLAGPSATLFWGQAGRSEQSPRTLVLGHRPTVLTRLAARASLRFHDFRVAFQLAPAAHLMTPPGGRPSIEEALAELRAEYEAELPSMLGALRAAVGLAAAHPDDHAARRHAATLAHRMHGSAGSHGFGALGAKAAEIEVLLAGDAWDAASLLALSAALDAAARAGEAHGAGRTGTERAGVS